MASSSQERRQRDSSQRRKQFSSDALARAGLVEVEPGHWARPSAPVPAPKGAASAEPAAGSATGKATVAAATTATAAAASAASHTQAGPSVAVPAAMLRAPHRHDLVQLWHEAHPPADGGAAGGSEPGAGARESREGRGGGDGGGGGGRALVLQSAESAGEGEGEDEEADADDQSAAALEAELVRVHQHLAAHYKRAPFSTATRQASQMQDIGPRQQLDLLRLALRPGGARTFRVLAYAFWALHFDTPAVLFRSAAFQHDALCVCCAHAVRNYHVDDLDPVLKVLAVLARHGENRRVMLRYGAVGSVVARLRKIRARPGAEEGEQARERKRLLLLSLAVICDLLWQRQ
eukprot:g6431.t1